MIFFFFFACKTQCSQVVCFPVIPPSVYLFMQAVQLDSVSPVRVRYLIVVSTLANKHESILLGMDFPKSDRCV